MTDQELIEAVATKVMGWHREKSVSGIECYYNSDHDFMYALRTGKVFNPLTDANHWLMVVEKIKDIFNINIGYVKGVWRFNWNNYSISHKSIGHAVCLAALEAVKGK
jgi:hypothetical protein